jgi:DNA-binding MarR family transcriptional regulator
MVWSCVIVHSMNLLAEKPIPIPTLDQALRLRSIVSDIVQCCQDRALFEAEMFDIPQAELRCLLLFKNERYPTAKSIARDMEVGKSRVTKVVNGLLEKNLVEKIDDPRDGRIKLLSLTKPGKKKMGKVDEFITEVHSRVLSQLETPQRATVFASLEQLWTAMETVRDELGMDD